MLLARDVAVRVLFSDEFLPAIALFPLQMVGDLFRSVAMTIQLPLLQQERFRARNIQHLLQYGVFVAVFYLTPASDRLMGVVRAHVVSWAFTLVMCYVYTNWLNGYKFDRDNWRLLITGTAAVVAVACLPFPDPQWRLVGSGIAAVWTLTAMSGDDWRRLVRATRERIAKTD